MKSALSQLAESAILLSIFSPASAVHSSAESHGHNHASHRQEKRESSASVEKRSTTGSCKFLEHPHLVAVTVEKLNGGWAMSPNQECSCGGYCPFCCVPGMVMSQWEDGSSYATESRMNGGLHCQEDGELRKPFPEEPHCKPGTGTVSVKNEADELLTCCQTVLPGNENMLCGTEIEANNERVIAVPGPDYWQGTAAQYYANPLGTGAATGCQWGDQSQPVGNWAPYTFGAHTDANGATWVDVGPNPIYSVEYNLGTKFPQNYGLRIECIGGGCSGLPCAVERTECKGTGCSTGAGGAPFCTANIPKGGKAVIVAYKLDGPEPYVGGAGAETPTPDSYGSNGNSVSSSSSSSTTTSTSTSASITTTTSTKSTVPPPPPSSTSTSTSTSTLYSTSYQLYPATLTHYPIATPTSSFCPLNATSVSTSLPSHNTTVAYPPYPAASISPPSHNNISFTAPTVPISESDAAKMLEELPGVVLKGVSVSLLVAAFLI